MYSYSRSCPISTNCSSRPEYLYLHIYKYLKYTTILIIRKLQNSAMNTTKVASKYILGPKIGSGSFGEVFAVSLPGTQQIFALKKQDQKSKNSQLVIEYKILKQMSNTTGFAKVHYHGTQNKYNQLIMDMLGPSLEDLFQICGKLFSLKTAILLVDQMILRIEELHNQNYIHRDIKPENFLMGINKNSHIVHLIDFGLSKKYRDSKTLQHIPYKENKNLTGTARYASINAHLGIQQSRRDDLEAVGYVLLYFLQGFLPWQGIKANNKNEKYQKIMEKKMSIPIEVQCKGLPIEISTFLSYCRSLKFNDKPDYSFLRRILKDLLEREGHKIDYRYDWTILSQDKSIDNGKIRISLKSAEPNCEPDHSKKELKLSGFNQPNSGELGQSKIIQRNNWREPNPNQVQEQNLLLGEQNMSDNDIEQEESAGQKNVGMAIDMQEKKNQLYDNDIEMDQSN